MAFLVDVYVYEGGTPRLPPTFECRNIEITVWSVLQSENQIEDCFDSILFLILNVEYQYWFETQRLNSFTSTSCCYQSI